MALTEVFKEIEGYQVRERHLDKERVSDTERD